MTHVIKYSTINLLKNLSSLSHEVYLLFYDLDSELFDGIKQKLSVYLNSIETEIIKINKIESLIVFCYLNSNKLQMLVDGLDSLDIGEFEISEYRDKQETIALLRSKSINHKKDCKLIYVNKDERVIQLYNIK